MFATTAGLVVEYDDAQPQFEVVAAIRPQVGTLRFFRCRDQVAPPEFRRRAARDLAASTRSADQPAVAVPRRRVQPIPPTWKAIKGHLRGRQFA